MLNTVENKINASFQAASCVYSDLVAGGNKSALIVWAPSKGRFFAFPDRDAAQEWSEFHQCPLAVCNERGVCTGEGLGV